MKPPKAPAVKPPKTPARTAPTEITVRDPDAARSEADADVSFCRSSQSSANSCCGNPATCTSAAALPQAPTSGQSLGDYCRQMQALGATGANANGAAAAACYSRQSSCSSSCADLADKYDSLVASCGSCGSLSIYQSAARSLRSMQQSCDGLASRVQALNNQAMSQNAGGGGGDLCSQMAQASPQSAASQPSSESSSFASSSNAVNCADNPSACAATASAGIAKTESHVGFKSASAEEKAAREFNIFPTSYPSGSTKRGGSGAPTVGAASAAVVPNNSGGGFGGDGGARAQLDILGDRKVASSGVNTDILQESTRSGGGFSYGGGPTARSGSGSGFANISGSPQNASPKMSLLSVLPKWIAENLPFVSRRRAAVKTVSSYCRDGGMIGCDLNVTYPRTMGSLDGAVVPEEPDDAFGVGASATLVFVVTFLSVATLTGKWSAVTAGFLKLTGKAAAARTIAEKTRSEERRIQNVPVAKERRAKN